MAWMNSFSRYLFGVSVTASMLFSCGAAFAQEPAEPAAGAGEPAATEPATTDPKEPAPSDPKAPAPAPKAGRIEIVSPETPYKQLPYAASLKDDLKLQNDVYKTVVRVLSGDELLQEKEAVFRGYFTQFMFPKLTELSPETGLPVNDLPDTRIRIIRDYVQRADNAQAREMLIDTTYQYMKGIVRGHFHPLAQYNAMLIIGELNREEARTGGSNPSPPQPLETALGDMIRELENPAQNDAVRVAALIGINRHARLDGQKPAGQRMPAANKVAMVGAVSKILFDPKPSNRSQAGQDWMRRLAIEIIGHAHDPGVTNRNAKEFARIIADKNEPRSIRLAAGLAFSKLEFDKAPSVNPSEVVGHLSQIALDIADEKLAALKKEADERVVLLDTANGNYGGFEGGGMIPGGIGGMGRPGGSRGGSEGYGSLEGGADPFALPDEGFGGSGTEGTGTEMNTAELALIASRQYRVDNFARDMVAALYTSDLALRGRQPVGKGLSGMADAKTQENITALVGKYKTIYKTIADNREDLTKLNESLTKNVNELRILVVKAAPEPITSPDDGGGLPGGEPTGLPGAEEPSGLPGGEPADADGGGLPGGDEGGLPGGEPAPADGDEPGLPGIPE